jgi:hypothetical protein
MHIHPSLGFPTTRVWEIAFTELVHSCMAAACPISFCKMAFEKNAVDLAS